MGTAPRSFVGSCADMDTLAEISDKMVSIAHMWAFMAVLAAPFLLGMMARWLAWTLLPIALAFSSWVSYDAYWEALVCEDMSHSILTEMGLWWAVNSILSPLLPLLAAVAALTWAMKNTKQRRGSLCDTPEVHDSPAASGGDEGGQG